MIYDVALDLTGRAFSVAILGGDLRGHEPSAILITFSYSAHQFPYLCYYASSENTLSNTDMINLLHIM